MMDMELKPWKETSEAQRMVIGSENVDGPVKIIMR